MDKWTSPPRARDLPGWRLALADHWGPNGAFRQIQPLLAELTGSSSHPDWEYAAVRRAELWFVRTAMCDLLASAAVDLPATPLTPEHVVDTVGLVVFETPLSGIDADGTDNVVTVGAMLWGPCVWQSRPDVPSIGITVYGPLARPPWLQPLGSLIWPMGEPPECRLENMPFLSENVIQQYASMTEDRQRLMGLWLLSSQPGLTHSERRVQDRASMRQSQRAGTDPNVRVIQLRRTHPDNIADRDTPRTRTFRHRWTVAGHWRNQAHGPGYEQHRPVYINPYLKGKEGDPLLESPKVKVWAR